MNYAALGLFWFIALLTVASAIMVVTARNILHAAFSLTLTLFGVAALYLFLHADFVAAVQLIVYVGGILVLIMFSIMFSAHTQEGTTEKRRSLLGLGAGLVCAGAMFFAVVRITDVLLKPIDRVNAYGTDTFRYTVGMVEGHMSLGHLLMAQYLLPFEVASVLILAALLGAVVIVRKETS